MFDSRASLPKEVKADIEQFLNNARGTNLAWAEAQVLPCFIRRNIKLAEAPSYGKTIFEYEPLCHGAEDYKKVAELIHNQQESADLDKTQEPPIEIKSVSQPDTPSELEQPTVYNPPQPQ